MIKIRYSNGSMEINPDAIFPAKPAEMKTIVSAMLDTGDTDAAESIHAHILEKVNALKKARDAMDPEQETARIAKVNAEIRRYLANAKALERFGCSTIIDDAAKIVLKKAIVHTIVMDAETRKRTIKTYSGWTFNKSGYEFELYKYSEKCYRIQICGTGLYIMELRSRTAAIESITPNMIEKLHQAAKAIEKAKEEFTTLQNAERAETISESAPASDPEQKPEPKQEEQPEQPKQASATPEAERTAKPEKFFIGTTISGDGWKIFFDGDAQRTRIIFSRDPSADERAEVEDAGFYYSKKMGSWNKKLTFKAYRAALKVAKHLQKIARTAAA